jgi:hypothetical protein
MHTRTRFMGRLAAVAVLASVLVAGTYAYTAANTVPDTKAGDGSGNVTGYVVSAVHYTLNATTLTNVDSVAFTLDTAPPAGSTIKIQVDSNWYSCTNSAAAVTCSTTSSPPTVLGMTTLRVVVAQ